MEKHRLVVQEHFTEEDNLAHALRIIIIANIIRLITSRKMRRGAFGTPIRGEDT
jgi:hypothetical protein